MSQKTRITRLPRPMQKTWIEDHYRLIVDADDPSLITIMEMDRQVNFDVLLHVVFQRLFEQKDNYFLYDYVANLIDRDRRTWYINPLLNQLFALDKFVCTMYRYMVTDLYFDSPDKVVLNDVRFCEVGRFIGFDFEVNE
jgi:hypothetical protein